MGLVSGIVIYIVIWWVVIFMILPWGIRQETNPAPEWAVEAPANPRLGLKFFLTTIVAAFIWTAVYWVIE